MAEFFSFMKVAILSSAGLFIVTLILLALPQSRLRCVGIEMTKWAFALGLVLLVPSPVDVIPDLVPGVGWLDDAGYLVGAGLAVKSAFDERKKRKLYEEIELDELRRQAASRSELDN